MLTTVHTNTFHTVKQQFTSYLFAFHTFFIDA